MSEQAKKQTPRHLVMFLLFVVFVLVNCFFVEGHAYFDEGNRVDMNLVEYLVSLFIVSFFDGAFFLLAVRYYHPKVNWPLFTGLMSLFLINAVAVAFFPGIYDTGDLVYWPSISERIHSIFTCFFMVLSLYVTLVIAPQIVSDKTMFDFFFLYLTINALVAVFYSYIAEASLYAFILKNGGPSDAYSVPQSFTNQRNVYATLLFCAMMGQAYLHVQRPHWWRWVIMLFLFINQFFIFSKTCILLCCLFLAAFALYRMVLTFKKHPLRNSIFLGLFLVGAIFVISVALGNNVPLLSPLKSLFDNIASSMAESFSTRIYNWGDILRKLFESPITTLFGFGMGLSRQALNLAVYSEVAKVYTPVDNAYVMLWANYGVFGLLLYAAFLGYLIYRLVKAFQKKLVTAWVSLFVFLALIGHSLTEETNFMGFMSTNVVAIFMAVVPLTSEAYAPLYQRRQADYQERYSKSPAKPSLSADEKREVILKWLTPLAAMFLGVSPMLAQNLPARFHYAYGSALDEICGVIALILVPLAFVGLSMLRKEKSWAFYGVILGSFSLGILLALLAPWTGEEIALEGISLGLFAMAFVFLGLCHLLPSGKTLLRLYGWPLLYLAVIFVLDFSLTYGLGSGTSRYLCFALLILNLFLWWIPLLLVKKFEGKAFESLWDYCEEKFTFSAVKGRLKEDKLFGRGEEANNERKTN